ncbi:hypothetical protein GCM10007893_03570 [Paracoccus marinus]|nr:hypothetical protein GCM10007893_03570 [Paracoccus marinus]
MGKASDCRPGRAGAGAVGKRGPIQGAFTRPWPLPALAYYVTYRKDYHEAFYAGIAELCETVWTL